MEYICLNCGAISNSLECQNCGHSEDQNHYYSIMDEAKSAIRYGYDYRIEAEKNSSIHASLLAPSNLLEWVASAIASGITFETLKFFAIKIVAFARNKFNKTLQDKKAIEILTNEDELLVLFTYVKDYINGLPEIDKSVKKHILEEIEADFIGDKCSQHAEKEGKMPSAVDISKYYKEFKERQEFLLNKKQQLNIFKQLKINKK